MNILLNGTFELANGVDRTARVLGDESWQWNQATPETTRTRAAWATFFPARATRRIDADLFVTFPQSSDAEAAFTLAHELAATLPTGGTMEVTLGETTVTYAQFVPRAWSAERIGVHVGLRLSLTAVNPDVAEEARAQFESGEFQEFETNTFD
jgi:hypothetical protein